MSAIRPLPGANCAVTPGLPSDSSKYCSVPAAHAGAPRDTNTKTVTAKTSLERIGEPSLPEEVIGARQFEPSGRGVSTGFCARARESNSLVERIDAERAL